MAMSLADAIGKRKIVDGVVVLTVEPSSNLGMIQEHIKSMGYEVIRIREVENRPGTYDFRIVQQGGIQDA